MSKKESKTDFYGVLKCQHKRYDKNEMISCLSEISQSRIEDIAEVLTVYITENLPKAIERKKDLGDYRTNPYVLLTSASILQLKEPQKFGEFLFNSKLYAGLETSFGRSIENALVSKYPINNNQQTFWEVPLEKQQESETLKNQNLTRSQKAMARNDSVWREIDKSCVIDDRRYLVSIKSGPNCINDTQVAAMVEAIRKNYLNWLAESRHNYPEVNYLDLVIGITYGTDKTTNNKENQILAKLLSYGFQECDREKQPGIIIDPTNQVRIYRCIGQNFWSFIGNPTNPLSANFVFLEVLLALSKALAKCQTQASLEDRINRKLEELAHSLLAMRFPRDSLPNWVRSSFSEDELFWLATAMTSFFDQ